MLTTTNVKTITDMRQNAKQLLDQASQSDDPLYLFYNSRPKAVLINLEKYQRLQEIYQDYLDAQDATAFEALDKKKINWLSEKEFRA